MNAIRTYFLFTLATLVGMSWFFQKINQQDFYMLYFRSIAEISARNSQQVDYQAEVEFHFAPILPDWKPFANTNPLFKAFSTELFAALRLSSIFHSYQISFPHIAFYLMQSIGKMLPAELVIP